MKDTTEREAQIPLRSMRPAAVERHGRDAEGLAQVEVVPVAARVETAGAQATANGAEVAQPSPAGKPRPIGPGRKERAYQDRIAAAQRELETARMLERGSNRMLDRLEREAAEARRMERRLSFALGALQAQNLALQSQNNALQAKLADRDAAPRLER